MVSTTKVLIALIVTTIMSTISAQDCFGIYITCHPIGSPEGTKCDDYFPYTVDDTPLQPQDYIVPVQLTYTVINESTETHSLTYLQAVLTGFVDPTDSGLRPLTTEIKGEELEAGQSITIETEEALNLSERTRYTVLASTVGENSDNASCRGVDTLEFVAGFNSCNNSCIRSADCTCENHFCSYLTFTCKDMAPVLNSRSKVICRGRMGGVRRGCSDP